MDDAAYIAALKAEREGYARRGDQQGVQDVDAELRRMGVTRAKKQGTERAVNTPRETR
jgi:hypothetical protein